MHKKAKKKKKKTIRSKSSIHRQKIKNVMNIISKRDEQWPCIS
jgi:hypothetical protein